MNNFFDVERYGASAHYWAGPFVVHLYRRKSEFDKGWPFNRIVFEFDLSVWP